MRLSQVFAITLSALLGMGIATAMAVFMDSGNRYHLSLGVDSGDNFTVHPASLPSVHDTTDSGHFEAQEDSTAFNNRWSPGADRLPSVSPSELEPVALAPDLTEPRRVIAVASDDTNSGYLRAATWTSESSGAGDVSLEILERQTEEIRQLTRQIEMLQKVMMEKPFDSAVRSRVPRAWTSSSAMDSLKKNENNEELFVEFGGPQKVGPTDTDYARNCAEIERLLGRMEQMKQQLKTQENTTAAVPPVDDRDRDSKLPQSGDVEEDHDGRLPIDRVKKTRPIEMLIVPASRPRHN